MKKKTQKTPVPKTTATKINQQFWFAYHAGTRELRDLDNAPLTENLDLFKVRDGAAYAELSAIAAERQFHYGGIVFNLPKRKKGDVKGEPDYEMAKQELPYIGSGDVILLATRPPLNDYEGVEERPNQREVRRVNRCVFQRKRTPVPIQSGHSFQLISDSCRSEATLWG